MASKIRLLVSDIPYLGGVQIDNRLRRDQGSIDSHDGPVPRPCLSRKFAQRRRDEECARARTQEEYHGWYLASLSAFDNTVGLYLQDDSVVCVREVWPHAPGHSLSLLSTSLGARHDCQYFLGPCAICYRSG